MLERYKDCSVIVEGKRDAAALRTLGLQRVYILNEHQGALRERIERIATRLTSKEPVCVLTDNDAEGRKLIAQILPILHELGIPTDQAFRRAVHKAGLSHIEGLATFLKNSTNLF